jgi:DNA-binding MarR family transcriptional regulator
MPTATTTADLAARLRVAILHTSRRMRRAADPGLPPALTAALAALRRHGPMTPSELAAHEGIARPTATGLIRRMGELGYVTREPDARDRRSCSVRLTPKGEELIAELRARREARLARELDSLGADDLATLEKATDLLARLFSEDSE